MSATSIGTSGNGYSALLVNVSKYGSAAVIGIYLAWQLAAQLPVLQSDIADVRSDVQSVRSDVTSISSQHEQMKATSDAMMKLLRGICLNTAQTKEESFRCN